MSAVPAGDPENLAELPVRTGPGGRLQAARKAKGLPLDKVAAQLHLSDEMIHALEHDEYEQMPARVFVQGYLRNYARLVGLPVDSILEAYLTACPPPEDDEGPGIGPAVSARPIEPGSGSNFLIVRLMTWVIVFGLLGLFVTWWQGYLGWPEKGMGELAEQVTEQVTQFSREQFGSVDSAGEEPVAEPAADEPVVDAGAPISGEILPDVVEDVIPARDEAVPEDEASLAALEAAVNGEPLVVETGANTAAGSHSVMVHFKKDSWVDIRAQDGSFKMIGKYLAGADQELGGNPPYKIVVGNSAGVRMSVDGEPYDIEVHSRGNVARFIFDPASPD